MPPKGFKKGDESVQSSPSKGKATSDSQGKAPIAKKVKVTYRALDEIGSEPIPISIAYEGEDNQARLGKHGSYTHSIKLEASAAFSLSKTVVITSGEYEGHQAILLVPSKAFPLMKLPEAVRNCVYQFYFAPGADSDGVIDLDHKRSSTKDVYSKSYASGSKNRVALLSANKEIYNEAILVLYSHTLCFDTTAILLDFLGQIETSIRKMLISVRIKNFVKSSARNAMHFLAESDQLQKLHIDAGVFNEADAPKAAKLFWAEAGKLLTNLSAAKGDPQAAVGVLSFGRSALTYKDDKKVLRAWKDDLKADFRECLLAKLK